MQALKRPDASFTVGELKTMIANMDDDALVFVVGHDGERHKVLELIKARGHDPADRSKVSLMVPFGVTS